ncbi:MAG: DUF433 domain-containing protein [Planctomycetes bacterium]|nr:DUF433 domain-containing protein [Planctomycetota bacterium]
MPQTAPLTPIDGYAHLARTPQGTPIIARCPRMRVMDVAAAYTCDFTPDEIQVDFPFLSPPEIYQAIAFYLDNREEIDRALDAPSAFARLARRG